MSVAIVYNHSLQNLFGKIAESICKEVQAIGEESFVIDNFTLSKIPDDKINFSKCIFFDKDIIQGIRLEMLGVRLFNNIGAIEACDDKRRSTELLRHDFKVPKTIYYPLIFKHDSIFFEAFANEIAKQLSLPVVAKAAFGSLGMQVFLLNTVNEIIEFQNKYYPTPHLYSEFIKESRGRDMRVYIVGGKICASMIRENKNDFRSNISLGGKGIPFQPSEQISLLAADICNTLSLDFAGIDLLFSDDDKPYICEVNSNAMFTETDKICKTNIAAEIAAYVVNTQSQSTMDLGDLFNLL